jgi:hypothetical protein
MFLKLSLRSIWILLFVLSSLWVAAVFGPFLYSVVSPSDDLWAFVHALQGRGVAPPRATGTVQETLEGEGLLGRAIHIAHYTGGSVTRHFDDNVSHTMKTIEDTYIAWFQKIPRPVVLVVRRFDVDGVMQGYEVSSANVTGFLVRGNAPPVLAWAISILLVRKRRSPLLKSPPKSTVATIGMRSQTGEQIMPGPSMASRQQDDYTKGMARGER